MSRIRRYVRRALTTTILLAWLAGPAEAQQYRIDAWTTDDGLPQNTVNRIVQTRDGFIWFTTFGGLVRFDGAHFEVFNTGTTPSVLASRFTNLFEDREGGLWAGTDGDGVVRYRNGVFQTFKGPAAGLTDDGAQAFFYDDEGHLLLDSPKGMVEWAGDRFVRSTRNIPSDHDGNKRILSTRLSGARWYFEAGAIHKFEHGRVIQSVPMAQDVRWLFEDSRGRLWIEVAEGPKSIRTLMRFADGAFTRFSEADGVPSFNTMWVSEARDGAVWFGLHGNGGVLRFQNGAFTRFTMADGLPHANAGDVVQDREGTLWVGTEGGLARLTERIVTPYTAPRDLGVDNTYPIYQDVDGSVLIGGWPGLTRYKNGVFEPAGREFGITDQKVTALLRTRDGGFWIGMWGWGGLRRIGRDGIESFESRDPAGGVIRAIYEDRSGQMWFGGNSGLTRYRGGVFTRVTRADGFDGNVVLSIAGASNGSIWIGTDMGVTTLRGDRYVNYGRAQGFPGTNVRAIYEDRAGVLWFGTYDNGLFRYERGQFRQYTTSDGLFDNGVFQILEDARGNFWTSSNAGLSRVARQELDDVAHGRARRVMAVSYGKRDGMVSAECNGGAQPAGIRARDGRLWFPTQKGVAVVDADHLPLNTVPPPVVITSVRVDQQRTALANSIDIGPSQSILEIDYAGLTYQRPELTRFRYKIEGLDVDWQDVGNRRTAYFSHLPSGHFRFVVGAANRDGVWNETGASLSLIITPAFYRTVWFQALVVAGFSGLAYLAHRRRIGLLRREQALRDLHARQLIDAQERDRKRIAAEIHDSLSQNLVLIHKWARQSSGDAGTPATRTALDDISEVASTTLKEMQDVAYNLGPYQLDRLGLKQTIVTTLERASRASAITFTSDLAQIDGILAREVEISLFRMVQESVNNVMKHSGATEAVVAIGIDATVLSMTVQDNGRGLAPRPSDGSHPQPPGFGLVGLAERARMLGGTCAIDSAPGFGTRVDVTLPLTSENTRKIT